ncbi:hypothetical protein EVAR_32047_1 [Eumeta japonica]|uniref:Uncharacterized protein n=1 Tax=Eumeta variegata TaxID=151549 RepID=A0A4C1WMI5_EUMVA|nr:hypothetical protein EVAR_32047_1 [Eumeta japonica]
MVRFIAEETKILTGSVHSILPECLGMKKHPCAGSPKRLRMHKNKTRLNNSRASLEPLQQQAESFFLLDVQPWMKRGFTMAPWKQNLFYGLEKTITSDPCEI